MGRLVAVRKLRGPQSVDRVGLRARAGGRAQGGMLHEGPGPLDLLCVCLESAHSFHPSHDQLCPSGVFLCLEPGWSAHPHTFTKLWLL